MVTEPVQKTSLFTKKRLLILMLVLVAIFFALMLLRKRIPFVGGLVTQTPLEAVYVSLEDLWSQGFSLSNPTNLGAFGTISLGGVTSLVGLVLDLKKKGEEKLTKAELSKMEDLHNLEADWSQKFTTLRTSYDGLVDKNEGLLGQVDVLSGKVKTFEGTISTQASQLEKLGTELSGTKSQLSETERKLQDALDSNTRLTRSVEGVKRTGVDLLSKEATTHRAELSALESSKNKIIEDLQIRLGALEEKNKVLTDKNARLNSIYSRAQELIPK